MNNKKKKIDMNSSLDLSKLVAKFIYKKYTRQLFKLQMLSLKL
jgi:hypothetical protein